jgi:hypothetical protein
MTRRTSIPKKVRESVLKEYRHRCSICGGDHPQLHHIDEDPSNHDRLNLLPVCPNCHLTDVHDPTRPVSPRLLRLFREHRDPLILRPEFVPLFRRAEFLLDVTVSEEPTNEIQDALGELLAFVRSWAMGAFYAEKVKGLVGPSGGTPWILPDPDFDQRQRRHALENRRKMVDGREEVFEILTELLRYQGWSSR